VGGPETLKERFNIRIPQGRQGNSDSALGGWFQLTVEGPQLIITAFLQAISQVPRPAASIECP
jgi:hypothetical protein